MRCGDHQILAVTGAGRTPGKSSSRAETGGAGVGLMTAHGLSLNKATVMPGSEAAKPTCIGYRQPRRAG
jgi:hypothetical protein